MHSSSVIRIVLFAGVSVVASSVAPVQNGTQIHVTQADLGPKAFLGKESTKSNCKEGPPNCGAQVEAVLKVNKVLQEAVAVEKKAEKAETESRKLLETVAEVKSAKKEGESLAAAQKAVKEKVQSMETEVKNEVEELKETKQVVVEEEKEAKKAKTPEAKAVVVKDEEEMKAVVKEEEDEAAVKKREEKTVEKEATVKAIEAQVGAAAEAQKENQFVAEVKTVNQEKELLDTSKVEIEVMMTKQKYAADLEAMEPAAAPAAAAAPDAAAPAKPKPAVAPKPAGPQSVAEEIKKAELPKLNLAVKVIGRAKEEAKKAVVEEEKAVIEMKVLTAETEDKTDKIAANMDTIKRLDKSLEPCPSCEPLKVKELKSPVEVKELKSPSSLAQHEKKARRLTKGAKLL